MAARPKGAPEKQVLAWWLCEHTTVRRRRVGERLSMGEESRDTQALRRVRSGTPPEWQRLKEQWERVYAAGGET